MVAIGIRGRGALVGVCASVGLLTVVASALADKREQGPADAKPSGLRAGVARADISPPVGIAHLNWGSQTHLVAKGVDPVGMRATALVLSDGQKGFVMVDVDVGGPGRFEGAIKRAAAATGIPEEHIRIGATHTHASPNMTRGKGPVGADLSSHAGVVDRYFAQAEDKIVGAIVEAYARLRPVHMYGGRGVGTININRRVRARKDGPAAVGRNPDEFVDRELVVFRLDDEQGKPYAVIANFQCHGTVLAYENDVVSPDWIGMARQVVEQALPGATALFFQGAAGNQGPIEGFTGDLGVAHKLGSILGHEIAAVALHVETVDRRPVFEGYVQSTAYQARQPWRVRGPRDARLGFVSRVIEVPRRRYKQTEIVAMKARVDEARALERQAQTSGDPWRASQAAAMVRRLSDLLAAYQAPFDAKAATIKVSLSALRIGDLAIVAMPGEPFAEIGAAVKKASPFAFTMFAGYSNGEGGDYMPIASEYQHGGYEVERSPYDRGAAAKVVSEATRLLKELAREVPPVAARTGKGRRGEL